MLLIKSCPEIEVLGLSWCCGFEGLENFALLKFQMIRLVNDL